MILFDTIIYKSLEFDRNTLNHTNMCKQMIMNKKIAIKNKKRWNVKI